MDWATQKKMKYYILLVVLVIGIIFAFLFPILTKEPTCTDKKQNGDERGIDCGGSCQFICQSDISPVEVEWTRALPSGDKRVNIVAYIHNNNKTFVVPKAAYKFTLYDKQGGIITTHEGEAVIPANTTMPIFAGPITIGERKVQSTTFEWKENLNFANAIRSGDGSYIEIKQTTVEQATTTTRLVAQMKNTTRQEHINVPVVAILYDADDNAALVSRTLVDRIPGDSVTEAVFFWNATMNTKPSKIEVIPVLSGI